MLLLLLATCTGTPGDSPGACPGCADSSGTETDPRDSSPETDDSARPEETGDTADLPSPAVPPKVILFIGDGMGFEHVKGGGLYAYGVAGAMVMESLPFQGRLVTASLTGVTDSAAGATALGAGVKTWNNVVGQDRSAADVPSVLELARERGLSGGIVTTDTLTGATPASFYAHIQSRYDAGEIAAQLALNPPDLLLGGGALLLDPSFEGVDVQRVSTRDELLSVVLDGRPFLGVFAAYNFPYVFSGYTVEPSLVEMTAFALDTLDADPDGFFLLVEGARIDHASHSNASESVHLETAAFDEAIATALTWAQGREGVTIVVTADHECGGLQVTGGASPGEIPTSTWRRGDHTNADVPVFAQGALGALFDGERLDNTWVHAVLSAALLGLDAVVAPESSLLVDGRTDDLGATVVTQAWPTSFGDGYNQLDGLRVAADTDGLWVGVDGVFELGENSAILLVDLDYGAGTGLGADGTPITDLDGDLEAVLTNMPYTSGLPEMGFDLAFLAVGGEELRLGDMTEVSGLRGLRAPWANDASDLWWLAAVSNFDDGNLSGAAAALDAGGTGATVNGWEIRLPWDTVYPDGLPADGLSIGLVAVLANSDGGYASNQTLPPLPDSAEPGGFAVLLESAVFLQVDGAGVARGPAEIVP